MSRRLAAVLGLALLAPVTPAQTNGITREQMWWAPTAEDWKQPVLITWQRTWKDAVAASRETGRMIMICVNMDGEIASEHYAGIRYRNRDIAKLYKPYITVIASVYRHNPRDYDEQGRRIPCPRFGGVTCGEHIAIEPGLFEKYFEGERVAPRHIGVELDSKEAYDIYYAFDTDSVFGTIRKGIAERRKELTAAIRARPERTVIERVASRDSRDRKSVESAYRKGDRALRHRLIQAAMQHSDAAPVDLLRLAVFGLDSELNRLARQALAQSNSENSIDLIHAALGAPMAAAERDALIAALQRLGKTWPRARTLAAVHLGLASRSKTLDVQGWSKALAAKAPAAKTEWSALESQVEYKAGATRARPQDATAYLELAEASLALAIDPKTTKILTADLKSAPKYARLMFQDAHRAATKAARLGATGWRVNAAIAVSTYYLGNVKAARARAAAAVREMPSGEQSWNAMAVLGLFAEGRMQSIANALRDKKPWPKQWLTDVHASFSVLARHPLGTPGQVLSHYDFLKRLGAGSRAAQALEAGLARFPDEWLLHDRLRGRILAEKGVAGLEPAYAERLRRQDAPKNLVWFAGYNSIVAAEFHRRAGNPVAARGAYDRAIAHFEHAIETNPDSRRTSDHFIALALAGRARLALERKDSDQALGQLVASFERKPESAGSLDGLGISPVATAQMLRAQLNRLKRADLVTKLETALGKLDPEVLRPPAFERMGQRRGRGGNRRTGRRRRRR